MGEAVFGLIIVATAIMVVNTGFYIFFFTKMRDNISRGRKRDNISF